jgi:hypothetical protein
LFLGSVTYSGPVSIARTILHCLILAALAVRLTYGIENPIFVKIDATVSV